MNVKNCVVTCVVLSVSLFSSVFVFADDSEKSSEMRGKYLVEFGGCNDCHTTGYAPSGGATPEDQWLLGDSLGYNGPWGTTYPTNLREYFGNLTEEEWVVRAKTLQTRPPMPWWSINVLTEEDARAVYRFVRSLGVKANEVPAYLPPDQVPALPYLEWHVPAE